VQVIRFDGIGSKGTAEVNRMGQGDFLARANPAQAVG
jgi:hypothetical protein